MKWAFGVLKRALFAEHPETREIPPLREIKNCKSNGAFYCFQEKITLNQVILKVSKYFLLTF